MKIICDQQKLWKALNTVQKAVSMKTTIPILKGILIKTLDSGKIVLMASDEEITIERICEAEVIEKGEIVLPSRLFLEIIRKMQIGFIEIEVVEKTVSLRSMTSEFTLTGEYPDNFPAILKKENEEPILINKELFRSMIRRTSFSASIDESRGVLTGVLMEIKDHEFNMVALDGFRMAIANSKTDLDQSMRIVISARILNEISKTVSEEDEDELRLVLDEKKAIITIGQTTINARLLEGEFINYREIIPKINRDTVIVERELLIDAIDRASLLGRDEKNNLIKMSLHEKDKKMVITSRSEEGNVKEDVVISLEGNDMDIGLNSRYLSDALKASDEDTIRMEFNTNVTPCLMRPVEGDAFLYLILPVRLSNY